MTAAQNSHDMIRNAVFRRGILWTDVARYIEAETNVPYRTACDWVAECIAGNGCRIAVAAAVIDLCSKQDILQPKENER